MTSMVLPEEAGAGAGADPASAAPSVHDQVIEALKGVYDPEIPVNIYDLGLIYRVQLVESATVEIDMTLTAPSCPVAGHMPGMVQRAVAQVKGIDDVKVELVWEPAWTPERMSEEAKLQLDFW